jgi:hypothetical protein
MAEATADERTGAKYHKQIQKAGAKADAFVDSLKEGEKQAPSEGNADTPSRPGPS